MDINSPPTRLPRYFIAGFFASHSLAPKGAQITRRSPPRPQNSQFPAYKSIRPWIKPGGAPSARHGRDLRDQLALDRLGEAVEAVDLEHEGAGAAGDARPIVMADAADRLDMPDEAGQGMLVDDREAVDG